MRKIILAVILVIIGIGIIGCSSTKQEQIEKKVVVQKPVPEPDRYAVIYFEIYDRSECNSPVLGLIDDGEFFFVIENSSNTREKIILPVNYSSQFKRDKGFIRTPLKWNNKSELLVISLMDDNGIDKSISNLITKAESIGGMLLMTEKGFFLFKTALEYYSGKPWDQYINKDILGLGKTEPCGNATYRIPTTPPKSINEAKYINIMDGDKLKMKIKIYFSEK